MSALTASSLASLVEAFPEAPKAELERFAAARPGKGKEAVKFYKSYVKWRSEEGSAEALVNAAAPAEQATFYDFRERISGTGGRGARPA